LSTVETRPCERQAELVARGASRTMNSRHLTGHAVDLVALDRGRVSWQWEDYYEVAAAMQAAAHELGVPVRWGGGGGSLFTIETPEDGFADYVAACRASRSWMAWISSCRGPAGMIDWIRTVQGIAAIVAVIFATIVA
jgi:hypothetical protein